MLDSHRCHLAMSASVPDLRAVAFDVFNLSTVVAQGAGLGPGTLDFHGYHQPSAFRGNFGLDGVGVLGFRTSRESGLGAVVPHFDATYLEGSGATLGQMDD